MTLTTKKVTTDMYFGPNEEKAVVEYLKLGTYIPDETDPRFLTKPERANKLWVGTHEEAHQRELIFKDKLKKPLTKMIDLIMKRYGLTMNSITFEELHDDTFGDIALKLHKFKPSKNKKAYSYYGTIIKRYLINEIKSSNVSNHRHDEFESMIETLEEDESYQYQIENDEFNLNQLIENLRLGILDELEEDSTVSENGMTYQERRVGEALITLFNNKESIVELFTKGNKPSKKHDRMVIIEIIKGCTNLTAVEVRDGLKRYKSLYDIVKYVEVNKKQV